MKYLLILILLYLIWKLIKPYLKKKIDIRGSAKRDKIQYDAKDIDDADFEEIDDKEESKSE